MPAPPAPPLRRRSCRRPAARGRRARHGRAARARAAHAGARRRPARRARPRRAAARRRPAGPAPGPQRTVLRRRGSAGAARPRGARRGRARRTGDPAADEAYDGLGRRGPAAAQALRPRQPRRRAACRCSGRPLRRDYDNAFWDGRADGLRRRRRRAVRALHRLARRHRPRARARRHRGRGRPGLRGPVRGAQRVRQRRLRQPGPAARARPDGAEADWLIGADLLRPGVAGSPAPMRAPGTAYDDPVLGERPAAGVDVRARRRPATTTAGCTSTPASPTAPSTSPHAVGGQRLGGRRPGLVRRPALARPAAGRRLRRASPRSPCGGRAARRAGLRPTPGAPWRWSRPAEPGQPGGPGAVACGPCGSRWCAPAGSPAACCAGRSSVDALPATPRGGALPARRGARWADPAGALPAVDRRRACRTASAGGCWPTAPA